MRTTRIIRRIDDLGRVVIPREIRKAIGIREGDLLEIYTDGRETVGFRKYKPHLTEEINRLLEQIEIYGELPDEIWERVGTLLSEVRELVKGEE